MFRSLSASMLALSTVLIAGCGGSFSGVQAEAPAIQEDMASTVQSFGRIPLFRGSGYIENYDQHVEPLWTITLQSGQRIGFRWVTDEPHKYDPTGPFHLVRIPPAAKREISARSSSAI